MPPPKKHAQMLRIAIVGGDAELRNACSDALREVATLTTVALGENGALEGIASDKIDALLIPLEAPLAQGIAVLAQCRTTNPTIPLIIVARGVDADLAVELVACGAHDFVSLPLVSVALHAKIERALGARAGPAITSPLLAPLKTLPALPARNYEGPNKRRVFRVRPPADLATSATTQLPGGRQARFVVEDLAIGTEWPSGMLLSTDLPPWQLPFAEWETGGMRLRLQLPDGEPPMTVVAHPIPDGRQPKTGRLRFAVQYAPENPTDVARLQAFWVECQRRGAT